MEGLEEYKNSSEHRQSAMDDENTGIGQSRGIRLCMYSSVSSMYYTPVYSHLIIKTTRASAAVPIVKWRLLGSDLRQAAHAHTAQC